MPVSTVPRCRPMRMPRSTGQVDYRNTEGLASLGSVFARMALEKPELGLSDVQLVAAAAR